MKYSIAKNVQIVIALLKAHGINQLVLSPGGTNAPFIRGIQDDKFFTCYSIVDERSALYFAIGLYLASGNSIAVCCTSAQATRNYLPGLTEAFYKHVPILAITFSKHPQYTYQDYMQAPDQTSIPKDSVRASFSLPYVSNDHDRLHCERLVNEAILALNHHTPAPVQLNVPMLDSELSIDIDTDLPNVKVVRRIEKNIKEKINVSNKKVLLVIGENRGFDNAMLVEFARKSNTAIYVNHLSNVNNKYTVFGNLLLTCIDQKTFDDNLCPDILITIGGQTGDYPLYHKLAESNVNYEHWRVSEEGNVVDTYDHLTRIYECSPYDFFQRVLAESEDNDYFEKWSIAIERCTTEIDLPISAAYIAQRMCSLIPIDSYVNFSILNSLRIWNYFRFKNRVKCFCNVGAFGIDGCMSTFLGQSVTTDALCYLFIGDLSFFYDMNSLGIRHIKNNVRIILINNNGGVEFKIGKTPERNQIIDKYIAAAGHFKNAAGWAISNGFDYYEVKDKETFCQIEMKLTEESNKPILVEVITSDLNDSNAYKLIKKANDNRSFVKKVITQVKHKIKKM